MRENGGKSRIIAYTGVMTALTAISALYLSVPSVSGGHTNLCDFVIFLSAALFGPVPAMIAGGVGSFLADIIAYPTTAVFSLLFHGAEGLFAGLLIKHMKEGKKSLLAFVWFFISGLAVVVGFFFAKAFFYGSLEAAVLSLYRNLLQIVLSDALAVLVLFPLKLYESKDRL